METLERRVNCKGSLWDTVGFQVLLLLEIPLPTEKSPERPRKSKEVIPPHPLRESPEQWGSLESHRQPPSLRTPRQTKAATKREQQAAKVLLPKGTDV